MAMLHDNNYRIPYDYPPSQADFDSLMKDPRKAAMINKIKIERMLKMNVQPTNYSPSEIRDISSNGINISDLSLNNAVGKLNANSYAVSGTLSPTPIVQEQIKQAMEEDKVKKGIDTVERIRKFTKNKVITDLISSGIDAHLSYMAQAQKYSMNSAEYNKYMNKKNVIQGHINIAKNTYQSVAQGIAIGGKIGGITAAINIALNAVQMVMSYNENMNNVKWNLQTEAVGGAAAATRLGLVASGRGRRSFLEFKL